MSLSNPLNVLLLAPITYLIYRIIFPSLSSVTSKEETPTTYSSDQYNWIPSKHPDVICYKKYTPKQLVKFDGVDGGRILLSILRVERDGSWKERTVFDVSAGKSFYGPDGVYGNFAGRDASRGMAKQSFELDMLTSLDDPLNKLSDLTPAELDNMRGWHEHFERKYIVCGELVEEGDGDQ